MLFATYKGCISLREVEMGMSVCYQKLSHLGINYIPARSTLSEANAKRDSEVFAVIHQELYERLRPFLPDSRSDKSDRKLFIIDSTTVSLFQEIIGTTGKIPANGKRKGGFKVHTLIRADEDVPRFIRIGRMASNDVKFLKEINLPEGSVLTFDKGYVDYGQYNRLSKGKITIVTRLSERSVYAIEQQRYINLYQQRSGILEDYDVLLGRADSAHQTRGRIIRYIDPITEKELYFFTNNKRISPLSVAQIYRKRWQIELLFKRLKQNYTLKYFLGDNENAIRIQTWCALIADLLLKVIKSGIKRKWSFSGIVSVVRQHLLEYIHLINYLEQPEKILEKYRTKTGVDPPDLFSQPDNRGLQIVFP